MICQEFSSAQKTDVFYQQVVALLEEQGIAVVDYCEDELTVRNLFKQLLQCAETLLAKGFRVEKSELCSLASALRHVALEACKEALSEEDLEQAAAVEHIVKLQEVATAWRSHCQSGEGLAENSAKKVTWLQEGIKSYGALLGPLTDCEKVGEPPITKCVLEAGKKLKAEMQVQAKNCAAFMLSVQRLKEAGHGGQDGKSWRHDLTKATPWQEIVKAASTLVSLQFSEASGKCIQRGDAGLHSSQCKSSTRTSQEEQNRGTCPNQAAMSPAYVEEGAV